MPSKQETAVAMRAQGHKLVEIAKALGVTKQRVQQILQKAGVPGRPARPDLSGQKFGRWTVLEKTSGPNDNRAPHWLCRCDCGSEQAVNHYNLVHRRSRGCLRCRSRGTKIDLTGMVFGRWTVLGRIPTPKGKAHNSYWLCRCACGRQQPCIGHNLTAGRSGGCLRCNPYYRRGQVAAQTSEKGMQ